MNPTAQPPPQPPSVLQTHDTRSLAPTFGERLQAHRLLDNLGTSYSHYSGDLAATIKALRAGHIPKDRLDGLRTSTVRIQTQLTNLLTLLS